MERLVSLANSVWQLFLTLPPITQWAVAMLMICALIAHLLKYNEHTVHEGPSIFTTAGIFFTFLGIAEGLYEFDPQKIDVSIPVLLNGLKTAFIASVVGVGAALSLKLRYAVLGVRRSHPDTRSEGATVDDLYGQLVNVQHSLVGSDESTLISQLKLTRQDTNDRLDTLSRSQTTFMQKLAESNSKALIIALQEVIRDFNTKITDQFGDNFRQLNHAVGAMLDWQAKYREQISEMINQQGRTAENMQIAASRYEALVADAKSFAEVARGLGAILGGLEQQRGQITSSLEQLAKLLQSTSDGLPKIENKVLQLTEQVTFGVKQNQDEMTKVLRDSAATIQSSIADVRNLLLETTQAANSQINDHMRSLADKTNEQFVKLDTALETELSKSISSLGRQLTALSKQFVEDYLPLTDRLRAMVQLGRG
jgi:ABC-type transporter Mla subunit MlaD